MLFWIYQIITGFVAALVTAAIWNERTPGRQVTGGMVLILLLLRLLLIR